MWGSNKKRRGTTTMITWNPELSGTVTIFSERKISNNELNLQGIKTNTGLYWTEQTSDSETIHPTLKLFCPKFTIVCIY